MSVYIITPMFGIITIINIIVGVISTFLLTHSSPIHHAPPTSPSSLSLTSRSIDNLPDCLSRPVLPPVNSDNAILQSQPIFDRQMRIALDADMADTSRARGIVSSHGAPRSPICSRRHLRRTVRSAPRAGISPRNRFGIGTRIDLDRSSSSTHIASPFTLQLGSPTSYGNKRSRSDLSSGSESPRSRFNSTIEQQFRFTSSSSKEERDLPLRMRASLPVERHGPGLRLSRGKRDGQSARRVVFSLLLRLLRPGLSVRKWTSLRVGEERTRGSNAGI